MDKEKFWKSKKFWTLIAAIVTALTAFFCSCTTKHYVTQSAVSTKKGDTTEITIKYEQIGTFKK